MRQDDYGIYVDPLFMRAREIKGGLLISVHSSSIIATVKVVLKTGKLLLMYWQGEDNTDTPGGTVLLHGGISHENVESKNFLPDAQQE